MQNEAEGNYLGYSGFIGDAKNLMHDGERLSIVGRHSTDAPCGPADVLVLIKPGTSRADTLALLAGIAGNIEAYGGWEHTAQSDNVVPFSTPDRPA